MILTGKEIEKEIKEGRINISPFNAQHLQPNSYDLHLDANNYKELEGIDFINNPKTLQGRYKDLINTNEIGFVIMPNTLYLFSTIETTETDYYATMIEGISSNARMGISIHETAGFGDIGFKGKWTLEVTVKVPTPVWHGMRIAQIYFHKVIGEINLYKGRYQNQNKVEGAKPELTLINPTKEKHELDY